MDLDDASSDHSAVSREGEATSHNTTTNTNPTTSSPEKIQASKQSHADHTVNPVSTIDDKGTIYELPPVSFPATPYPIPNPRAFILANFGVLVNPQPQQPSVVSTTSPNNNKRP